MNNSVNPIKKPEYPEYKYSNFKKIKTFLNKDKNTKIKIMEVESYKYRYNSNIKFSFLINYEIEFEFYLANVKEIKGKNNDLLDKINNYLNYSFEIIKKFKK